MALGYNIRCVWFRASYFLGWNVFFVKTWWLIEIWSRWRSTMIAKLDMCWLCSRHVKMSLKCLCNVDWSLEHSVFCVSNVTKLYGIGLVCIVTGETRVAAPAALNLHLISKLGILAGGALMEKGALTLVVVFCLLDPHHLEPPTWGL